MLLDLVTALAEPLGHTLFTCDLRAPAASLDAHELLRDAPKLLVLDLEAAGIVKHRPE
jgi:hypothetical protein